MGRPSSFRPEFVEQAEKLCLLGATDADVADFFGVDVRSIYRWKVESDAFCQALKRGKDVADAAVERRLFQRATGYSHDAVKIFHDKDKDEPVVVPYVEHYPPDTTAAIFWLKNRKPAEWRDRVEQTLTGPDGGPVQVESVTNLERAKALAALVNAAKAGE